MLYHELMFKLIAVLMFTNVKFPMHRALVITMMRRLLMMYFERYGRYEVGAINRDEISTYSLENMYMLFLDANENSKVFNPWSPMMAELEKVPYLGHEFSALSIAIRDDLNKDLDSIAVIPKSALLRLQ